MSELAEPKARGFTTTAPEGLGVVLEVLPLRGMISVRGDLSDPALAGAVKAACGQAIPNVRKGSIEGDRGVLWMSPDELLLVVPYVDAAEAVARFDGAIGETHALAVDVSDARTSFRISGEKARQVLAKGAPVDLSPEGFTPGDFRRTRLGVVAAAFLMTARSPDTFELVCFRSYADYVWKWLTVAADEDSLFDL